MRIFCELRSIFPSPAGARKNTSNEQNVRSYYARPSNKRFIIPLQKKLLFDNWLLFFGKSIQKHPDSVWENDVNNEQNVRAYYAKPLNERLIMYCKRKMLFWLLFSGKSIQNILILLAIVAPSPCIRQYSPCCKPVKPRHYSVLRPRILLVLLTLYGKMT